jgi:hypothetical protein
MSISPIGTHVSSERHGLAESTRNSRARIVIASSWSADRMMLLSRVYDTEQS